MNFTLIYSLKNNFILKIITITSLVINFMILNLNYNFHFTLAIADASYN